MEDYLSTVLRGEEGVAHLRRCVQRALKTELLDSAFPFTEEDAGLLLRKFGCREFLGGGTFGAVFLLACGKRVVKFVPQRPAASKPSSHGCLHEFLMQQKFAALDLALPPKSYQSFGVRGCPLELGAIEMPRISLTLERRLHAELALSPKEARRLSRSLVWLLQVARAHGLVHNDLKCNNLGVGRREAVYFLDFGKSFDEAFLRAKRPPSARLCKMLDVSTAIDAWRLQASIRKCFERREASEDRGALLALFTTPLQALAQQLLEAHGVLGPGCAPDEEWWQEDVVLQELKKEMARCFAKRKRDGGGGGPSSARGHAGEPGGLADEGRQRGADLLREGEVAPG
jgi:hypothetical protein